MVTYTTNVKIHLLTFIYDSGLYEIHFRYSIPWLVVWFSMIFSSLMKLPARLAILSLLTQRKLSHIWSRLFCGLVFEPFLYSQSIISYCILSRHHSEHHPFLLMASTTRHRDRGHFIFMICDLSILISLTQYVLFGQLLSKLFIWELLLIRLRLLSYLSRFEIMRSLVIWIVMCIQVALTNIKKRNDEYSFFEEIFQFELDAHDDLD